jgi:LacI family transcriptional regulator
MEAADACGFQLNTNAQQLKQQRSNNIYVLVKGSSNQLFGELVEAIQTRVAASPYHLVVDYMDESRNEVLRAVQVCREKKPLGLLMLGGNRQNFLADFDRVDVPCVLVTNDGTGLPFANLSSVSCNDDLAVQEVIEGLIRLGHRKIAIIGGDRKRSDTTLRRYQGCMQVFQAHHIDYDPERDYRTVRFSYDGGYQGARELFEQNPGYTAIFCMADVMAMGAIRALTDRNLQVPKDVSVVGFDGLAIGEFIVPRLSTVSQNAESLAQRSLELLMKSIELEQISVHEIVPAQLQWKESTREV